MPLSMPGTHPRETRDTEPPAEPPPRDRPETPAPPTTPVSPLVEQYRIDLGLDDPPEEPPGPPSTERAPPPDVEQIPVRTEDRDPTGTPPARRRPSTEPPGQPEAPAAPREEDPPPERPSTAASARYEPPQPAPAPAEPPVPPPSRDRTPAAQPARDPASERPSAAAGPPTSPPASPPPSPPPAAPAEPEPRAPSSEPQEPVPPSSEAAPSPSSDPEAYFQSLLAEAATEPTDTTTEEPGEPRTGPPWVVLALIAVAALLAIVTGTLLRTRATDPGPEGTIVARAPVGPEGGTVPFGEGARLIVPAGAVESTHIITVRRFPEETAADGDAILDVAESRYAFEPADLRFQVPVRVVLPVPAGSQVAVQLHTDAGTREVPAEVDPRTGTVEVRTRDFTSWTPASDAGGLGSMGTDVR